MVVTAPKGCLWREICHTSIGTGKTARLRHGFHHVHISLAVVKRRHGQSLNLELPQFSR